MTNSDALRRPEKGWMRFGYILVLIDLVLIGPSARAGQPAIEEVGGEELLPREGIPDLRNSPPHSMHEHVFRVPVDDDDTRLVVTLLYPDGPGPFPLAVVNHGATGGKALARPAPRALMISPDGKAYGAYGAHAFDQAMADCQAHSARCEPYVVNDDVVWTGPGKK